LSSVVAAQAAPRHAWRELWLITIGHGLTHWYHATFYLLLPLIGNELGLSYSQIGLIMTCQYIASAVANVPGGVLVDTVGRKGLLMGISLFWVGFPYLLISFTHSYAMLLVCIALVGFGNALWHPTAIPTLGSRYPDRKGLVLSLHGMGGNVGDAIAPLVIGAALAVFSWREVVVLNVAPGLVVALLMFTMLGTIRLGAKKTQHAEGQSFGQYMAGLRQLLQLARNRHPLHRGPAGELRLPAQPVDQGDGAVGLVLAGLVEAAQPAGEDGLQLHHRLPDPDQCLAEVAVLDLAEPGGEPSDQGFQRRNRAPVAIA